jgi:coiled-coil domain-containing protein 22
LTENIEAIKEKIEDQEDIYRQLSSEKKEQKKSIEVELEKLEQLKKDQKLKMKVAMLLEKLEQSLEVARKKRENLNNKFESHKQPLEEHLASFSGTNAVKLQKAEEKILRIKEVKRMIKEIQEDVKSKTQTQQQLQTELSQVKRVTERSAYTSRIVDIVKSIKKQNNDINEILKDTKMLQKSINNVEGQLQRQFTVTEDLIWNNVSFDSFAISLIHLLFHRPRRKTNIPRKPTSSSSPSTPSSANSSTLSRPLEQSSEKFANSKTKSRTSDNKTFARNSIRSQKTWK